MLTMKQFGNPWTHRPWNVRTPSAHLSVSVDSVPADQLEPGPTAVVRAHLEARCEDQAVQLVLHAVDDDAGLGDPFHPVTVGVDEGHVVAVEGLQVLVVEAGSLAELPYQGLSASAVARSATISSTRARISSILAKSASSIVAVRCSGSRAVAVVTHHRSFRVMLVQASATRSSSTWPPAVRIWKFSMRRRCHPGCNALPTRDLWAQLARTSTDDGVRWKT